MAKSIQTKWEREKAMVPEMRKKSVPHVFFGTEDDIPSSCGCGAPYNRNQKRKVEGTI